MRARAPTQAPEWEEVCPKQRDTASRKARAAQFAERTASKRKDARELIKVEESVSRLQKRKKVTLQAEEREEMNDRKKRARKHAERTTLKQRKAIREHRNREDE